MPRRKFAAGGKTVDGPEKWLRRTRRGGVTSQTNPAGGVSNRFWDGGKSSGARRALFAEKGRGLQLPKKCLTPKGPLFITPDLLGKEKA